METVSRRDWSSFIVGIFIGVAIAAFTLSVGWNYGRAAGMQRAQELEQDWWEYTAKVDVVARWEVSHLPPMNDEG